MRHLGRLDLGAGGHWQVVLVDKPIEESSQIAEGPIDSGGGAS